MAIEPRNPRLAVLIDADNASSRIAPRLFDRPLPAEADARAWVLDRRQRVAAVAPGFVFP